jgi:F-type H+-transporting ATPase subunit delta
MLSRPAIQDGQPHGVTGRFGLDRLLPKRGCAHRASSQTLAFFRLASYTATQTIGESESDVATDEPSMATVAGRYASALFELAKDERQLEAVEKDMLQLGGFLEASPDLVRMVRSPVISAEEQGKAIGAIASTAGFSPLSGNFLQLLARSRRLFAISDILVVFRQIAARHRGEVTAEITSAHPLSEAQQAALEDQLKGTAGGRNIRVETRVDPSLLGGLVVKMGSRMIDSSLRTKLNSLKLRMKEVR